MVDRSVNYRYRQCMREGIVLNQDTGGSDDHHIWSNPEVYRKIGEEAMLGQLWKIRILVILSLVISLAGCQLSLPEKSPEQIPDAAFTQAAQTIIAELTQNAPPEVLQSALPTVNELALLASMTAEPTLPPTSTPVPTEIPLPTDTALPPIVLPPTNTTIPTTLPEPAFVPAFQDDFTSGYFWPTQKDGNIHFIYTASGYSISNYIDRDIAWSVRGEQYGEVRVEVVGSRVEGEMDDGYYGVICHFTDASHFYLMAVGSDGWYGIAIRQPGKLVFLNEGYDTSVINTGSAPNLIRADCLRGALSLWVNGTKLSQVEDHSYNSGAVGMAVGTRSEEKFVAIFDDFAVYVPE